MSKQVNSQTRNSIDKPADFSVRRSSVFNKDLRKLPKNVRGKIESIVKILKKDPQSSELNIESVKGYSNIIRIKIGRYRIIAVIDGNEYLYED